jgi:hypothetical protein
MFTLNPTNKNIIIYYMEVEIVPPSAAQMRKLKMGQPFRAKLGPGLKVNVPMKEAKKLQKAAMKGSGATLHGCSVGSTMLMMGNPYSLGGRGNVKATAKDSAKRLMVAGTDRAVRALEGSGYVPCMYGYGLAKQAVRMGVSKAKQGIKGGAVDPRVALRGQGEGNVKSVAKEQGKRLLVAGTDRAVRALEGSGMVDALITRAVMDGNGVRDAARASAAMNMGGAVNRRKKFNKWFKDIGQKFKPLAKNVKPIKQALTARAVDLIENYNNPQAQAQSIIDMAQKEFKDTAGLVSPNKKRAQSSGSASVRDDVAPAGLRRGTFISPMAEPQVPPQPVDVNDDGEPDGYFYPNEASWFGAGMPKGKRGFQGVRKALRHAGAGAMTQQQAHAMLRGDGMREIPPSVRPQPISGGMAGRPTIMPVVRPQPARGSGAKKTSPWIEHVKAYCAKHGCKYGEGLKLAKASYKTGGALYPAGYDPRYDR